LNKSLLIGMWMNQSHVLKMILSHDLLIFLNNNSNLQSECLRVNKINFAYSPLKTAFSVLPLKYLFRVLILKHPSINSLKPLLYWLSLAFAFEKASSDSEIHSCFCSCFCS
jgi:hypothetical protein